MNIKFVTHTQKEYRFMMTCRQYWTHFCAITSGFCTFLNLFPHFKERLFKGNAIFRRWISFITTIFFKHYRGSRIVSLLK